MRRIGRRWRRAERARHGIRRIGRWQSRALRNAKSCFVDAGEARVDHRDWFLLPLLLVIKIEPRFVSRDRAAQIPAELLQNVQRRPDSVGLVNGVIGVADAGVPVVIKRVAMEGIASRLGNCIDEAGAGAAIDGGDVLGRCLADLDDDVLNLGRLEATLVESEGVSSHVEPREVIEAGLTRFCRPLYAGLYARGCDFDS